MSDMSRIVYLIKIQSQGSEPAADLLPAHAEISPAFISCAAAQVFSQSMPLRIILNGIYRIVFGKHGANPYRIYLIAQYGKGIIIIQKILPQVCIFSFHPLEGSQRLIADSPGAEYLGQKFIYNYLFASL